MAVPAGAVTEYDLRLFIYSLYVRKSGAMKTAMRKMPQLLPWIFRFLEEEEGIRYPFAEMVLEELRVIEFVGEQQGWPLEKTLAAMSHEMYVDLDRRAMLHIRDPAECTAGWPGMMNLEVAELDRELQRRWLLWYDELVRAGTTDFDDLGWALQERQMVWENTPHPRYEGRTPADVVRAYVESEQREGRHVFV